MRWLATAFVKDWIWRSALADTKEAPSSADPFGNCSQKFLAKASGRKGNVFRRSAVTAVMLTESLSYRSSMPNHRKRTSYRATRQADRVRDPRPSTEDGIREARTPHDARKVERVALALGESSRTVTRRRPVCSVPCCAMWSRPL